MDIRIVRVSVDAELTCDSCGGVYDFSVDDGDTYFSESQMIDAVAERIGDDGWDEDLCPDCVDERDNPENEDGE